MRNEFPVAALVLSVTLSACGQDASPTNQPTAAPTTAAMSNMQPAAAAKMAKGTGVVTALDASSGTITLDHRAMPEVEWPAMTMTFSAEPQVLEGVKVGDKVSFDASIQGSAGKVTAISKK